jgi:choice-of-anchor A domain-containing protein
VKKKSGSIIAVLMLAGLAIASKAQAGPFSIVDGYNLVVLGSATVANVSVAGRVAVGGSATFSNFSIGNALTADPSRLDFVVGGHVTMSNGSVARGSAEAASATASGIGYTPGGGLILGPSPLDFASIGTALATESDLLASLAANGTATQAYSTLKLQGSDADLNVFSISAADVLGVSNLQIVAPTSSTVLINVTGTSFSLANLGISLSGPSQQQMLWNFADATSINLSNLQFAGSILAPDAALTFANGQIGGQVVVGSLNAAGAFNSLAFTGTLPDGTPSAQDPVVPEPSTWLLVATGVGLAGWYRARRVA